MKSFILGCVAAVMATADAAAYNTSQATKSVWLSEYAYCGHDQYTQITFGGPVAGFIVKSVIYDILDDTNGYIGYLPSDNSIYVVFRGSESILNWVTNLSTTKTAYTSYPECNCEVHKGFYDAE